MTETTERYVVITDDGLQMWAPMDRDVAEELASKPTPSGKKQYAVPERVAIVIAEARRNYTEIAAERLNRDRLALTAKLLAAYDDTKHLVQP